MSGAAPGARTHRWRALGAAGALLAGLGLPLAVAPAASAQTATPTTSPTAAPGGTAVLPQGALASSRNMRLVANLPKNGAFAGEDAYNSDLAFQGNYAYAGNYNGFTVYDISRPRLPKQLAQVVCLGAQNDISVSGNLLFLSVDSRRTNDTCNSGAATAAQSASGAYWEGIRIFDISNPAKPEYVSAVETDCGSHTHTLVPSNSGRDIFVYVSSYGPATNIARCQPPHDKISIVRVPVQRPERAAVVSTPVLFPGGGNPGRTQTAAPSTSPSASASATTSPSASATATTSPSASASATATTSPSASATATTTPSASASATTTPSASASATTTPSASASASATPSASASASATPSASASTTPSASTSPTAPSAAPLATPPNSYSATAGCHDITAYPAKGLAAGACMGEGVIMDISNPARPRVVETVLDTQNFSFWHSATFSNAADKVIFTDELGGGGAATCNPVIGPNKGANAIYSLNAQNDLNLRSYYKIRRTQASTENCVAHNGSLIPVNGRDIMVQAWYQGGISVFDFTNPARPTELGWLDRGPISDTRLVLGGSWSAYYYNGYIFSNDIQKGLDVVEITGLRDRPRQLPLTYNPQTQPRL